MTEPKNLRLQTVTRSFSRRNPTLILTSDGEQNPLLQPVVINVLMEHVPKRMWKTCRLVCKPWHDELLPHWRKYMSVLIGGMGKNNLKTIVQDDYKVFMDIPTFQESYEPQDILQLEKFPFRSVKTVAGEVNVGGCWDDRWIQKSFWTFCGPWLHRLHLHGVMFKNVEMLKDLLFRETPNLQQLEFSQCDVNVPESYPKRKKIERNNPRLLTYYWGGPIQPNLRILKIVSATKPDDSFSIASIFPISMLTMFSVFIHVEEVSLSHFTEVDLGDEFIEYLFDVFETLRRENEDEIPVLDIKKLDIKRIGLDFTPDLVPKLCTLSLPLKELHVPIDEIKNELQTLLRKYSALTKLGLLNYDDTPLKEPTFQLDALPQTHTELELTRIIFEDWNFLAFTPNLIKLKVDRMWFNGSVCFPKRFLENKIPLLKFLTTFYYDWGNILSVKSVEMFTKIMPNVTTLTLSVDCAGFEMVCNAWPKLTHWEIIHARVKETTFIANVNKLTNLKCLKMNHVDKGNGGSEVLKGFGNDSIEKGFLIMSKLERLCLTLPYGINEKLLKDLYRKVEDTKKVYVVRNSKQSEKVPLVNLAGNGREKLIKIVPRIRVDKYL